MRPLIVATHKEWVWKEMSSTTHLGEVRRSYGLDLPNFDGGAALWSPTEFAARIIGSGVPLSVTTAGPTWTADIGTRWTGRHVYVIQAGDCGAITEPGHVKPAESKHSKFVAGWYTPAEAQSMASLVPPETLLQVSHERLHLSREYRVYVRGGAVVTGGLYLLDGVDFGGLIDRPELHARAGDRKPLVEAMEFAQDVVDSTDTPLGMVVDIGLDERLDRPVVIEANPAWSSAWYGCDLDEVRLTIHAACVDDPRWQWVPDAYLARRALLQGPLT